MYPYAHTVYAFKPDILVISVLYHICSQMYVSSPSHPSVKVSIGRLKCGNEKTYTLS